MDKSNMSKKDKILLMVGIFMCMELGMSVTQEFLVAMPSIIADIGGQQYYSLVFTLNFAVGIICSLIMGKLSDIVGRRRLLLISIWIIFLSESISGFCTNIYQLMAMRAIQGVGGSGAMVIGLICISDIFAVEERPKYLGYYGSMNALNTIVAPLIGGFFVQYLTWRWVFYSIIPVGVIGLFLVYRYMPVIPRSKETKLDYPGFVLATAAIILFVAITSLGGKAYPWGSPTILGLAAALVASVVLLIFAEKRSVNPLIPLRIFRYRVFSIGFVSNFLFLSAGISLMMYLPLYWQNIMGMSPVQSGMLFSVRGIVAIITSTVSGLIVSRLKNYKWNALIAVLLYVPVVYYFAMAMTEQTTVIILMICAFCWGLGGGVLPTIFHTGVQMELPIEDMGSAMGLMTVSASLANAFASSVGGVFLANPNMADGINNMFRFCLGMVLVMLVLVTVLFFSKKTSAKSTNIAA